MRTKRILDYEEKDFRLGKKVRMMLKTWLPSRHQVTTGGGSPFTWEENKNIAKLLKALKNLIYTREMLKPNPLCSTWHSSLEFLSLSNIFELNLEDSCHFPRFQFLEKENFKIKGGGGKAIFNFDEPL